MRQLLGTLTAVLLLSSPALAQKTVLTGEGWEAFPNVQYRGGDSRLERPTFGILVLTDSTLAFHRCWMESCFPRKKKQFVWQDSALIRIPLSALKSATAASQNSGPSVGARIMFGMLATDKTQESVTFVVETETSAEAPIFHTQKTQSAVIEAKVQARLRRLAPATAPSDSSKPRS